MTEVLEVPIKIINSATPGSDRPWLISPNLRSINGLIAVYKDGTVNPVRGSNFEITDPVARGIYRAFIENLYAQGIVLPQPDRKYSSVSEYLQRIISEKRPIPDNLSEAAYLLRPDERVLVVQKGLSTREKMPAQVIKVGIVSSLDDELQGNSVPDSLVINFESPAWQVAKRYFNPAKRPYTTGVFSAQRAVLWAGGIQVVESIRMLSNREYVRLSGMLSEVVEVR